MTNINGRKAVITDSLERWTQSTMLANSLGYPDAAVPSERDKRRHPRVGDEVTVLSSVDGRGESVVHDNQRIFIVEFANGERHIFGEKGLRILDEKVTGVAVLQDESLGGIEREYREVKRKAAEGERIKIVAARMSFGHYDNGDIMTITRVDGDGDAIFSVEKRSNNRGGEMFAYDDEYAVLEPTDIVRINTPDGDGKAARFRMVDRKAAVGERVIVVSTEITEADGTIVCHKIGEVGVVEETRTTKRVRVNGWFVLNGDYRVLEPLTSAESTPISEPLSAKPAPDQAAEIIAKLATRVTALEKRVIALESGSVMPLTRRATPVKIQTAQEIRDDIVRRAKEDVEKLKKTHHPTLIQFYERDYIELNAEFIVDREKRTVVCLLRERNVKARVRYRGIAKCAPGDVFNSHIGRAISLRRALGLDIPEEYVSAPQPTEIRVGDVVKYESGGVRIVVEDEAKLDPYVNTRIKLARIRGTVIDDSRTDSAEPRKEVA